MTGVQTCALPIYTIQDDEKKLAAAKIKVFESKAGNDGKMRAAVCGIPKGDEHYFLIAKKDLKAAVEKGFELDTSAGGAGSK